MAMISSLSEDTLSIILCNRDISIGDVVNVASTCKYLRNVIENNNYIWRLKFYQRWPNLKKICEKERVKGYVNFKELIKASIKSKNELLQCLADMSHKYYDYYDIDKYLPSFSKDPVYIYEKDLDSLIHPNETTYSLNYHFLMDELTTLNEHSRFNDVHSKNLTNIYYAKKLLPFLKHYHLKNVWQELTKRPAIQLLSEETATFFAQWCQPYNHISYSHIKTQLNDIAQQVLNHLRIKHPAHPIFSLTHEQLSFWRSNNIDESQWDNDDGRQILESICDVFTELHFYAVTHTTRCQKCAFIDYVLEKRIGYILSVAVVFQSVARRLGIHCELISFPGHCFLSWKTKCDITSPDNEKRFYINIINGWSLLTKNSCPRIRDATRCPVANLNNKSRRMIEINSIQLILKLAVYINMTTNTDVDENTQIRWLLELQYMLEPDMDTIAQLSFRYKHRNISLAALITALKKIDYETEYKKVEQAKLLNELQLDEETRNKIYTLHKSTIANIGQQERAVGQKFAVGMLVKTTLDAASPRHHNGVIIKWNQKHSNNGLELLYTILDENDEILYMNEDSIGKVDNPLPHRSCDIGRYFCEYRGTYYMPNDALANKYPQDVLYLSRL